MAGTAAGMKFSKYIELVDQAMLELGIMLDSTQFMTEHSYPRMRWLVRHCALVPPPQVMVLLHKISGTNVGERCFRSMLRENL